MRDGSATNHYALTKKCNLAIPGGRSQISNEDYTGAQVDGDMDCYFLLAIRDTESNIVNIKL